MMNLNQLKVAYNSGNYMVGTRKIFFFYFIELCNYSNQFYRILHICHSYLRARNVLVWIKVFSAQNVLNFVVYKTKKESWIYYLDLCENYFAYFFSWNLFLFYFLAILIYFIKKLWIFFKLIRICYSKHK